MENSKKFSRKTAVALVVIAVLLLAGSFVAYNVFASKRISKDEMVLKIQLDLDEDIGLFLIETEIDGTTT